MTVSHDISPPPPAQNRRSHRQPRLIEVGNPLNSRLGQAFFLGLPRQPGVYLFYDRHDRLLYVGQSCDLRARVGSYRHVAPERHPRRVLRLVQRIARVELRPCPTAEEAVALEAALLLDLRPPFNRAGVWQGAPWWLEVDQHGADLIVRLVRTPAHTERAAGPLPPSFRYVLGALLRCVNRLWRPELALGQYPVGWLDAVPPLAARLSLAAAEAGSARCDLIRNFALRGGGALVESLRALVVAAPQSLEQVFWAEQVEVLVRYAGKAGRPLPPASAPLAERQALPLFPDL